MATDEKTAPANEADELISVQSAQLAFAHNDNAMLREAGFELAEAATRVVREYDGVHRLSIALSGWFKAVGSQGDRGKEG